MYDILPLVALVVVQLLCLLSSVSEFLYWSLYILDAIASRFVILVGR